MRTDGQVKSPTAAGRRQGAGLRSALWLALLLLAVGCLPAARPPMDTRLLDAGEKASRIASDMLGRPYRYNGNSPAGFDCSGLIQYSYRQAGVELPRGTRALWDITESIRLDSVRRGDLLFFDEQGRVASHVGMAIAQDAFIHAPSTGGAVRREYIGDPYWKKSFRDARRLMPTAQIMY